MKNHYKFWIVFSLIIVFAAGVAGGVLLDKYVIAKKPEIQRKKRSSVRFPTLDMMAQELNLSSKQQEQIREIFRNNEERFKTLRKQINERFTTIRTQLKDEIKSVLNDEQKLKFEAMIEKYRSQRRKETEERKKRSNKHSEDKGEKR
jgi:Spy/CpxP family protein refolding chaperone